MANGLFDQVYNPDVLTCLANLSSDEVFTPPDIANAMLDMLPQDLFSNPDTTFLDPGCKSGVFLREIAKRLIKGLETQFPDLQNRIDHIFHNQLYGISITELTSLLSRRSVYCSKYPNSEFSVSLFDDAQGNIRFKQKQHTWRDGKCIYCGVAKREGTYTRENMEIHAYEFIHVLKPEEIFGMKFDVIIGNPPYQLNVGVQKENYAVPIYQKFIEQAMKLKPRFLTMITPSRWFTGGRGLDEFRSKMLNDKHLIKIVDFPDSKDCFAGVDISGGVNYFLWSRDQEGPCEFVSNHDGKIVSSIRVLDEFSIFPRYNEAVSIIHKVTKMSKSRVSETVSTQTPFGFITTYKGNDKPFAGSISLLGSKGISFVSRSSVTRNGELVDKYKVIFSKATCEHAGTPDKNGQYRVISSNKIIEPGMVCTQSYLVGNSFHSVSEAENFLKYLRTKFFRFLLLQGLTSQDISREKFLFVPQEDYSKEWTDEALYEKYGLNDEEVAFIDSMIRPMNSEEDDDAD